MNIKLAFKIRLYIMNNFLKKMPIFNMVLVCVFFVAIMFISHINNISNNARNSINQLGMVTMVNFSALISLYFYLKTIIKKNTFKLKGVYSYISAYSNIKLDSIYLMFQFDRIIFSMFTSAFVLIFIYGFSKAMLMFVFKVFWMLLLIACSDFFSKTYTYINTQAIKRYCFVIANIAILVFILISSYKIKIFLSAISFLMNVTVYKLSNYQYSSFFERRNDTKKIIVDLFGKTYSLFKYLRITKTISFVSTKEIVQIYSEKIPLIYSVLYGVIILAISPLMVIKTGVSEIYNFSYFIAVAYSLIGLSLNICARDFRKEWIYIIYNITSFDIIIGKFIGFFISGVFINFFYFLMQGIINICIPSYFEFQISLKDLLVVIFLVFPLSFLVGGILGSCFVPKLKYKSGSIDYSYNGGEIVILLITVYIVSLPAYIYCYYFIDNAIILSIIVLYQVILFVLLKNRIELKILKRGERFERK